MPDRCPACDEPLLPAATICLACGEFTDDGPPHPAETPSEVPAQPPGTDVPDVIARSSSGELPGPAPVSRASDGAALPADLDAYRATLREIFGYPDFRSGQARVLQAVAKDDVLAVMPTGSGKSLCYVLPALHAGRTVVVSPLIALMQDQVESLRAAGVAAAFINSNLTRDEQNDRYRAFQAGDIDLLYVAPERFANTAFTRGLSRAGVRLLAIDEAHCISEWGHNFRPDYLQLGHVRQALGAPRTLALTATANPQVRRDIVARLGFDHRAAEVVTSVDRPNLTFSAHQIDSEDGRIDWLEAFARERPEQSGIIYAGTRKRTEELAATLTAAGVPAAAYHAGMGKADRSRVQRAFTLGDLPVIVATSAFGMGIDKPDVRYVVHFVLPGRLEAYYQEAGRAGRDGEPADCVLLHGRRDRSLQQYFIRNAHPTPDQVGRLWERWLELADRDGRIPLDAVQDAPGAPMAVAALRASGLLDDVEVRVRSRDPRAAIDLSVIAAHRRHAEQRLDEMLEYASTRGCRRAVILRYFGEESAPACRQCDNCRRPRTRPARSAPPEVRAARRRGERRSAGEAASLTAALDRDLLAALREWRRQKAQHDRVPAYTIAPDRTLEEIAAAHPDTTAALHRIWGLGAARIERLGDEIIETVRRHGR